MTATTPAAGTPFGRNGAYRLYDHTPPEWAAQGGRHLEVRPDGLDVGAHAVLGPGYRAWRVINPDGTAGRLPPDTPAGEVAEYLVDVFRVRAVAGGARPPRPGRRPVPGRRVTH